MPRPVRIAYARVAQESNAFSPLPSTLEDFRRTHWLEGDALAAACEPGNHECKGFAKNAELSGFVKAARERGAAVTLVPLLSVWAIPSGPLTQDAYLTLRDKLAEALAGAGPLDGLMLSLHGAMRATDVDNPEGGLLAVAREALGPDAPIGVSLDLHGNLTPELMGGATFVCGYHTNPHRDHAATGYRVGKILCAAALGEVKPVMRWRTLPMVLGGGTTVDFLPTMLPLFMRLRRAPKAAGVLDASLFMCHVWNDSPDLGWGTVAVTDSDAAGADALADELADRAWAVRHKMPPAFLEVDAAIAEIRKSWLLRRLGAVCVVDASDVVGTGTPGENTRLLDALLKDGRGLLSYVPLRDPVAVASLWTKPERSHVELTVGGRLDPIASPPRRVSGRILRKHKSEHFQRVVVLEIDDVRLVLTEGTPLVMKPAFYQDVGLDPWKADVIVVKSLFPWRLFFAPMNRKSLYVKTKGASDLDLVTQLDFNDPVHPRDPVVDWRPADRRRRGVA
jgi:microcystin degradation protein MlrC